MIDAVSSFLVPSVFYRLTSMAKYVWVLGSKLINWESALLHAVTFQLLWLETVCLYSAVNLGLRLPIVCSSSTSPHDCKFQLLLMSPCLFVTILILNFHYAVGLEFQLTIFYALYRHHQHGDTDTVW